MKKALSISLILTLLLSLSACGTSNAAKGTAAVKTVESQPQVETENKKEDKKDEEVTVVQPAAKTEPTEQISTQTTTKAVQQSTSSTTVKQSTKPTPTPTPAPTHQLNTSYNEWYNIRNSNNTTPGIPSLIKPWMGKYNAIFIGDSSRRVFYFTFDAGGETGYTNQILDVLDKQGIKATFFLTGQYISQNPDIVKRIAREGEAVANHTVNHLGLPTLTDEQIKQEYLGVEEAYTKLTGLAMLKCVRPPMGAYSEKSLYVTNQLGYKTVFWSIAYKDYDLNNQPTHDEAMSIIKNNYHNGAIVLLHIASKTDADTLDEMITFLKSQGYSFGVIS